MTPYMCILIFPLSLSLSLSLPPFLSSLSHTPPLSLSPPLFTWGSIWQVSGQSWCPSGQSPPSGREAAQPARPLDLRQQTRHQETSNSVSTSATRATMILSANALYVIFCASGSGYMHKVYVGPYNSQSDNWNRPFCTKRRCCACVLHFSSLERLVLLDERLFSRAGRWGRELYDCCTGLEGTW